MKVDFFGWSRDCIQYANGIEFFHADGRGNADGDGPWFLCRLQGEAMSKLFEEMAQGVSEARAYMEGERKGFKVTLPETVDVRGLRKRLRLSQHRFAESFGLSVDAVRHWESGRRQPEAAARALLVLIDTDPKFVMRSLAAHRP
jgi:putative transcriptional regulator